MTRYIILLLACTFSAYAQRVEIPFAFVNTVGDQSKTYGITVAAHPLGTNELDSALGEKEIPSLPPPSGVFIVYSIPPSTEYMWLSPLDVRKLEVGKQHMVEYAIGMTWNAGKLDVTWGQLPNLIDSAYIVDVVSDFPNNFIKVKLEPGKSYSTINTAITKLKVLVWYNATSLTVQNVEEEFRLYPNPCDEEFVIDGASLGSTYDIVNVAGNVITSGVVDRSKQYVSSADVAPGLYILRLRSTDGSVTMKKLLRK